MQEDDLLLFLWWGKDATEMDKEVWQDFQLGMGRRYPNTAFIEVYTQEQFDRESSRLSSQHWRTRGLFGSGAWGRMMSWSKPATNDS